MKNRSSRGVVAAGHKLTAEAAVNVLRDGGTAMDAAISGLAMACVCEPVLCSPGGGGFAMVRDGRSGKTSLIDFFPHTPLKKRRDGELGVREILANFGAATQSFHIGPATSATPGFSAGLRSLHENGATIGLDELVRPAVDAARNGVAMTAYQNFLCRVVEPILTATEDTARLFAPDGRLVAPGSVFRNPDLADALEIIASADSGPDAVTKTAVMQQTAEGHLTEEDFAAYAAIEREAMSVTFTGAAVHMNPLPAASGALIAHSLAHLKTAEPIDVARALIATDRARREADGNLARLKDIPLRQQGTTHLSVIDGASTACAATVSNGSGNGDLVNGFGFMLNNILGEEYVNPHSATNWPADARLSSMMCPTLIDRPDGSLIALGSGGSNRIHSAVFQVAAALCLRADGPKRAISMPRLHVEGSHLDFEDMFESEIREKLCRLCPDHRAWPEPNMFFGGVHAAMRDSTGDFLGSGDGRRDGVAMFAD